MGSTDSKITRQPSTNDRPVRTSVAGEDRRSVFLVESVSFDRLHLLGMWVLSAASMGERVDILLTAAPLKAWMSGRFGDDETSGTSTPDPGKSEESSRRHRAAKLGLPNPRQLIEEARAFGGVRVLTCDTEIRLAGMTAGDVESQVDEVVSLPGFWKETAGSRTVCV